MLLTCHIHVCVPMCVCVLYDLHVCEQRCEMLRRAGGVTRMYQCLQGCGEGEGGVEEG